MTRSEQMARIRSKDTKPELLLRRGLWARGVRYRIHAGLPGRPDIVFGKHKVTVFVDGCFWHGCEDHYRPPSKNSGYWRAKLARNRARDRRVDRALSEGGWTVMRVWEHEIRSDLERTIDRICSAIGRK